MTRVLALLDGSPSSPAVHRTAKSLAEALGVELDPVHARRPDDPPHEHPPNHARTVIGEPEVVLLEELGAPDVAAGVLGTRATHAKAVGHVALDIIAASPVPLILLPPGNSGLEATKARLLVPLDDSLSTSRALRPVIDALIAAGAEIRIVHFFDSDSLPPFVATGEDIRVLAEEFRRSHLPVDTVACDLRLGNPAQHMIDVATERPTDALVIAWGQDLGPGRAAIIRRLLSESPIPLIVVPVSR